MMWRIKELADPGGVLSPGVLLNRDPKVHLDNLKSTPPIEEVATACVECGFCEPVCPSRDLTTTPRQRIVLRREMARQPPGSPVLDALLEEYEYDALETCAADGTCMLSCPVGIDTGRLVKELRAPARPARGARGARARAPLGGRGARRARGAAGAPPDARRDGRAAGCPGATSWCRRGRRRCRRRPARCRRLRVPGAAAVYLPACVNRIFGRPRAVTDELGLPEALVRVSARAGLPVWIPPDVAGHCCGTPWSSKGYRDGPRPHGRADLRRAFPLE